MLNILKMKTFTRLTIDKRIGYYITEYAQGSVLDIGCLDSPYKDIIINNGLEYFGLDLKENENTDYIGDLLDFSSLPIDRKFDTVILTEVLEHVANPFLAVSNIKKILNEDGKIIFSLPFIYIIHGAPNDFFRFTEHGILEIFKDFRIIKLDELGTLLMSVLDLITTHHIFLKPLRLLNPLLCLISNKKNRAPLGYIGVAKNGN